MCSVSIFFLGFLLWYFWNSIKFEFNLKSFVLEIKLCWQRWFEVETSCYCLCLWECFELFFLWTIWVCVHSILHILLDDIGYILLLSRSFWEKFHFYSKKFKFFLKVKCMYKLNLKFEFQLQIYSEILCHGLY